jgi:hypothetical protein
MPLRHGSLFSQFYDEFRPNTAGTVVAGGMHDDGQHNLGYIGHAALEMLGISISRSIKFRESFAFIGTKGAAVGSVRCAFLN